jgi:hypothetical protein
MFIEEVIQMTERKMREAAAADPENPALKSLREDVGRIHVAPQIVSETRVAPIEPAAHFPAASNSTVSEPSKRKRRISHKVKTKPKTESAARSLEL